MKPRLGQRLAAASRRDGARGLGRMAKMSSKKTTKKNACRDWIRFSKRCSGVRIRLYWVDSIAKKRCGLASECRKKPILLPHEFLGWLFRMDQARFHRILGTPQQWADYWWEVIANDPEWFREHPFYHRIRGNPYQWVPCKIFGDDGKIGKRKAMLALHFYSTVGDERRTAERKLPIFVRNNIDAIPGCTDRPLWLANSWSWQSLGDGVYPAARHDLKPFEDKWRHKMAGKRIIGDYYAAMIATTGDWMWAAEVANLRQSYKRTRIGDPICHICGATCGGAHTFTNFADGAPHWAVVRSNAVYMASPSAAASPISTTPGFHIQSLMPELMHGGPLGYNLVLAGSVLKELSDEGRFCEPLSDGTWQQKLQAQLASAASRFSAWQKRTKKYCSQEKFTVRRLDLTNSVHTPTLKAKAYNSMVVVEWLEEEARLVSEAHPRHSYYRDRAACVWGLAEFYRVCRRSRQWMSEAELADLKTARDATLRMFRKLAGMASEDGSPLYPCRPKLHVFDHCHFLAQQSGENPASCWTFQDEDNMRILIDIAESCHGLSLEQYTLEKWCMQFFAGDVTDSE